LSDASKPVAWWSAKRLVEFFVHLTIFCLLWLVWSRLADEPSEPTKMLVVGGSVAAGLTWGVALWKRRTGEG